MKTITLEEQAAHIERRKAELGIAGDTYVTANCGSRRTDSKKALLKALAEVAGSQPKFTAKY